MLFTALAGGMGWGIRGQYGHETGAMLAGLLVALVLVFLFGYHLSALSAARAAPEKRNMATVAVNRELSFNMMVSKGWLVVVVVFDG